MKKLTTSFTSGFTLIEIIVTVGILVLISSVVIFNYSSFNSNLSASAVTQKIAVAIRQAQTYGLSVKQSGNSGDFNTPYGIYFTLDQPTAYYIFADKNKNGKYDVGDDCGGVNTECVEKGAMIRDASLGYFCSVNTATPPTEVCPVSNIHSAVVLFARPNPDAIIYTYDSLGNCSFGTDSSGKCNLLKSVKMAITSTSGAISKVSVSETGQISITNQ